jgi:hypothetical protein
MLLPLAVFLPWQNGLYVVVVLVVVVVVVVVVLDDCRYNICSSSKRRLDG